MRGQRHTVPLYRGQDPVPITVWYGHTFVPTFWKRQVRKDLIQNRLIRLCQVAGAACQQFSRLPRALSPFPCGTEFLLLRSSDFGRDSAFGHRPVRLFSDILFSSCGSNTYNNNNNNNNNNNKVQLSCHPVAVFILHVYKT